MPRKKQPVATYGDQPYGREAQLTQLQQQGGDMPNGGAAVPLPGARGATRDQLLDLARKFAGPLEQPLNAPSGRPGEHVMTGAASGPGAGPEVLHGAGTSRNAKYAAIWAQIAADIPDPRIRYLAQRASERT